MSQLIQVPGVGNVEFPDGMSDADIVAAIKKQPATSTATNPPQPAIKLDAYQQAQMPRPGDPLPMSHAGDMDSHNSDFIAAVANDAVKGFPEVRQFAGQGYEQLQAAAPAIFGDGPNSPKLEGLRAEGLLPSIGHFFGDAGRAILGLAADTGQAAGTGEWQWPNMKHVLRELPAGRIAGDGSQKTPLPTEKATDEMTGAARFVGKGAEGLAKLAPRLAASVATAGAGAPAWLAASAPMAVTDEGKLDPVGALIAAGLPGVSKWGEAAASDLLTRLPVSKLQFEWAKTMGGELYPKLQAITQRVGGVEFSSDVVRQFMEKGGGLVTANAYLLAANTPDILALPAEQRGQAALDMTAAAIAPSFLGFTARGKSKAFAQADANARSWWTEAKARWARGQAAPKIEEHFGMPTKPAASPALAEPPVQTTGAEPPPVPTEPANMAARGGTPPSAAAAPGSRAAAPVSEPTPTIPVATSPQAESATPSPSVAPAPVEAAQAVIQTAASAAAIPVQREGEAIIGKETFVKGANNTTLPARYAWLPLDQIHASHGGETFSQNPAYAPLKNTRDYASDPSEQEKVILGANNFDPQSYAVNVKGAAEGPLMVAPANDGRYRVLGGTGRKQMLDRLTPAKRDELAQAQDAEAAVFGLPPRPSDRHVLVRLLPAIDTATPAGVEAANRLVDVLNPSPGLVESTAKLAENDALKIPVGALRDVSPQTATGLKREFIAGLIGNGTLDRNTRSRLLKSDDELEDYVGRLLTHAAYRSNPVSNLRANPKTQATVTGLIDAGTPLLLSLRDIGDQAATVADSFGAMIQRVGEFQKQFPDKKLHLALQAVADQMEIGAGPEVKLAQQLAMVLAQDVEFITGKTKRGQPVKTMDAEESVRNFRTTLDRINQSVRAWQRDGGAGADIFGASRSLTDSVSDALKLMGMTGESGPQIAEPRAYAVASPTWRYRPTNTLREGDLFAHGGTVNALAKGQVLPDELYSLKADGSAVSGPDPRVRRYRELMRQRDTGKPFSQDQERELAGNEVALGQKFIADWNEIATRPDAPASNHLERDARLKQRLVAGPIETQNEFLDKPGQMSFFERKKDYENAVASGKPLTPAQVEFGFMLGLDSLGRFPAGDPSGRNDGNHRSTFTIPGLPSARTQLLQHTASIVRQQILAHGKLDIQGQLCRSVEEAAVLMQAFRLRQMEIFHWVMVKDGRVAGHYAVTTRRPGSTVTWEGKNHDFIREEMKRLGADGYYVCHNHPSGNPSPSEADRRATVALANPESTWTVGHVPGFLGHIVIDHTTYAVIESNGAVRYGDIETNGQPDPLKQRAPVNSGLNVVLGTGQTFNSDDVAAWGRQWMDRQTHQISLLFVDARGRTMATTDFDAATLDAESYGSLVKEIRAQALLHGAEQAFGFHAGTDLAASYVTQKLVGHGVLADAFAANRDRSEREVMPRKDFIHPSNHWFGLTDTSKETFRLAEDQARYDQPDIVSSSGLYTPGTPRTPGRVPPMMKVALGGMKHVNPVEMPELVKLVREYMGQLPRLKKMGKARGMFKGEGDGLVTLDPRIFTDEEAAAKTLAHEIGHWMDYMPDHLLRRGNVIGRLYSLRNFLKNTFGGSAVTNKDYRQELLAVTQYWKPYSAATSTPGYVKYRESAVELYADAISVLLNSPGLLDSMAPKFYSRFWQELNRKPEVREALFGLQDFLSKGKVTVIETRREEIRQGFEKGEELYKSAVADRKARAKDLRGFLTALDQAFGDRFAPIVKLANDANPAGRIIAPKGDIRSLLEQLQMRDVMNLQFARAVDETVRQPLEAAGLNLTLLGEYMLYKRIFEGDRAGLANPGGVTPNVARQHLLKLRNDLGIKQVTLLDAVTKQFHALVFDVMEEAVKVGIINREVFTTTVVPNKEFYAAFVPLKYVSDYVPPGIKKQVGTLENIANPFLQTILKTFALQNAILWQKAKLGTLTMLQRDFPGDIEPAVMRGAHPHEFAVEKPGRGLLSVQMNGQAKWFYVDPYIAEAFDRMHPGQTNKFVQLSTALLDKPFREFVYPLIIGYNPSFMLFMSPARDFLRTSRNLRALGVKFARTKLLTEYFAAFKEARQRFSGNSLAIIREMEANFAIGTPFDVLARLNRPSDDAWAEIMSSRGLTSKLEHTKLIEKYWLQPMQRVLMPLSLMADVVDKGLHAVGLPESVNPAHGLVHPLDAIEFNGMSMDISPKIGAYKILRREGWQPTEAAAAIRNYAGLPNIYRKGTWHLVPRAVVPFWNVFLQGARADLKLMSSPQTRSGWWWHFLTTEGAMAVLKGLAAAGVFGLALKKMYDGISEYQKTNYNVVPLGYTPGGDFGQKVVFGRMPMDETARVPAALLYKLTQLLATRPDQYQLPAELFAFGAGQFPTMNPVLNVGNTWLGYAGGTQPRDAHTGQPIVSQKEWSAGGMNSLVPMMLWTAEQSGAMNLIRFDPKADTTWAMTASAIPGLNKVLMTTDYGYREQQETARLAAQHVADQEFFKLPNEVQSLHAEYGRLKTISADARTPIQQARYEDLNQWYNTTYSPAVESIHEANAMKMSAAARTLRDQLLTESKTVLK